MIDKVRTAVGGDLSGVTVALWGLTFKADTDDLRDSPAIFVARRLLEEGAIVRGYDPRRRRPAAASSCPASSCAPTRTRPRAGADAVVLLTEWDEFRWLDFDRVHEAMSGHAIVDARNLLDPAAMRRRGFAYQGVGRR